MTVISNVYHTSQSLRSSRGGWRWGWDTPPCLARFLPSLSHHVWLGFYFLHFLWYLAPWCIFVHFCSLARVLPISLVTKIVCFPSVNLAATQIRWTLTYWAVCHWYVVRWGVSSTHRTRVYNSKSDTSEFSSTKTNRNQWKPCMCIYNLWYV